MPQKIISSFRSISKRGNNEPQALLFPQGWGAGPVFDWYNGLEDKAIKSLQIRKDVGGVVPHRFIVAFMCDGRVHRFDRRPEQPVDGQNLEHNQMDLFRNVAVQSEDTYIPNVDTTFLSEIEQLTHCEIELFLDGRVDLLAVLSACYAISSDDDTQRYTLLKHNCFFFSWTVLMVVSRHCLPYDIPQSTTLMARLESRIKPLTSAIVTEAVKLLDLIFEAVKIFRSKIDPSLREGVLSLNPKVLGFIWRRYCSLRLHLGFREQLVAQVEKQIRERIPSLYDRVIAIYTQANSVDSNLWIDDVKGDVESDIRTELSKILWDIALEAASSSVEGSLVNKKPGPGVPNRRLKFSVLGKGAAQFFAVVNDSFVAGISAGKVAGHGHNGTLSNEAVFDRVWEAASTTSLSVAQTVVAETNAQVNDPKRAALWEQMWSNWDDVMKECYIIVQPVFIGSMEKLTRSIVDIGGGTLIQEMKDSKKSSIRTRISQVRNSVLRPPTTSVVYLTGKF